MRASLPVRLGAISLDWIASYLIVLGATGGVGAASSGRPFAVLALFSTEYALLITLQGASLGHRLFGLKVRRISDGATPSLFQAITRTFFLILIVTALTYDENGRGIHERLSGTETIRV